MASVFAVTTLLAMTSEIGLSIILGVVRAATERLRFYTLAGRKWNIAEQISILHLPEKPGGTSALDAAILYYDHRLHWPSLRTASMLRETTKFHSIRAVS